MASAQFTEEQWPCSGCFSKPFLSGKLFTKGHAQVLEKHLAIYSFPIKEERLLIAEEIGDSEKRVKGFIFLFLYGLQLIYFLKAWLNKQRISFGKEHRYRKGLSKIVVIEKVEQ